MKMTKLNSDIIKDEYISTEALFIIQKYENFLNYFYGIIQNAPRRHGVFKISTINLLFDFPDAIYEASKSNQVSKLYMADSFLAKIRFRLRFMFSSDRRLISPRQYKICQIRLSEVGALLGSWIRQHKSKKG